MNNRPILFLAISFLIGMISAFSTYILLRKTDKVYIITPDLMKSEVDGNTWKIGDKEFWNTRREVRQNYDGHVVMTYEFTSTKVLMSPK